MIFDNGGNYLIIAGKKGEISLWKLPENMIPIVLLPIGYPKENTKPKLFVQRL